MGLLGFKDLPYGLPLEVGMRMGLGPLQAALPEVLVELAEVLHLGPGNEKAPAHGPHLVLDLTLLPAGRRRAGHRLEQVMGAQLPEAVVEAACLAGEDLVHRRLEVVVDPPTAHAPEELEGPPVGIEDHLLRLSRVGHHQKMPAVAQPQLRRLHRDRHARHLHQLVAPVELEGLPGLEHQRNVYRRRQLALTPPPIANMAPDAVIAAPIAFCLQLLEKNNRRAALTLRQLPVLRQRPLQTLHKGTQHRPRL
jgi:hypothetical protein